MLLHQNVAPYSAALFVSTLRLCLSSFCSSCANAFVDPRHLLAKKPGIQIITIVSGAHDLALQGPWAVTNKTALRPTYSTHDYLSFALYWWPDC